MSPFDSFHDTLSMPVGLSDSGGPILVGFPNEALIADWLNRSVSPESDHAGEESLELSDFPNDAMLVVCSAADDKW